MIELVDDGVPPPDGRPWSALGWAAATVSLVPPTLGWLLSPDTGLLPGLNALWWAAVGAAISFGLVHAVGVAGVVLAIAKLVARDRSVRPTLRASDLGPAAVHLLALALAKAAAVAVYGKVGLLPVDALLQWLWVAPAVAWLAADPPAERSPDAEYPGHRQAVLLLATAAGVVAAGDVGLAGLVLTVR